MGTFSVRVSIEAKDKEDLIKKVYKLWDDGYIVNFIDQSITENEEEEENKRICTECHKEMTEGFCIDGGCEYYCSEQCLHKHYTPEEWKEMYGDGETDSYWTQWED